MWVTRIQHRCNISYINSCQGNIHFLWKGQTSCTFTRPTYQIVHFLYWSELVCWYESTVNQIWENIFFLLEICNIHNTTCVNTILDSYLNAKHFFIALSHAHFPFLMSIYPIDQYQNTIPRAMLLHELKKFQLQERFTLMTHDSVGHLKSLCMSVLSLSGGMESEWKRYSSLLCIEKNA